DSFNGPERYIVGSISCAYLPLQSHRQHQRHLPRMRHTHRQDTRNEKPPTCVTTVRAFSFHRPCILAAYSLPLGPYPVACCMYRSSSACIISSRFFCTTFTVLAFRRSAL